ncbi:hypothetical protein GCM10009735_69750 [Actinomadura chokoriensis]
MDEPVPQALQIRPRLPRHHRERLPGHVTFVKRITHDAQQTTPEGPEGTAVTGATGPAPGALVVLEQVGYGPARVHAPRPDGTVPVGRRWAARSRTPRTRDIRGPATHRWGGRAHPASRRRPDVRFLQDRPEAAALPWTP